MTSSVDIFSAVNRKGGRLGGPAGWSSVEEGETEKAPQSFADGGKHVPDMETSGIFACGFTRVFRMHLGCGAENWVTV